MKKIILFIVVASFGDFVSAQETPTKHLSIAESNKLNGTPKEPTINGKPYSQYKAEQEALKKQQETKGIAAKTTSGPGMFTNTAPDGNNLPDNAQIKPGSITNVPIVDDGKRVEVKAMNIPEPVIQEKVPLTQKPDATITKATPPQVPDQFKLPSDIVALNLNAADLKPAPAKVQPVESKPASGTMVDDGKTDVLKAAIEKAKSDKLPASPAWAENFVEKKQTELSNANVESAQIATPTNIFKLEAQATILNLPVKTTDASVVSAKPVVNKPAANKEVSSAQSATPEIKVVQADADPASTKATDVKLPVAPSSDGKQELPAKKN